MVQALLRGCPLQELALSGCEHISHMDLRRVGPLHLEVLQLSETYVHDDVLTDILAHAPAIRSVDVCGCADLTDEFVMFAAANCERLAALKVAHCGFSNRSLSALSQHDRALEELVVGRARSAVPCKEQRINGRSLELLFEAGSAARLRYKILRTLPHRVFPMTRHRRCMLCLKAEVGEAVPHLTMPGGVLQVAHSPR